MKLNQTENTLLPGKEAVNHTTISSLHQLPRTSLPDTSHTSTKIPPPNPTHRKTDKPQNPKPLFSISFNPTKYSILTLIGPLFPVNRMKQCQVLSTTTTQSRKSCPSPSYYSNESDNPPTNPVTSSSSAPRSPNKSTTYPTIVRFSTNSSPNFYDRPVRRIFQDVSKTLDRSLTVIRKCRRLVSIVGATDFRKLFFLRDTSVADMKWLISVFDAGAGGSGGGGIVLSLPPIASNDPILAWVWSFIATIHLGQLSDKIEAANELSSAAKDNNRNKKMIAGEGGVPSLLKLLNERTSPEAQIAAATALFYLANDQDRARLIANEAGVPIIVNVLGSSPTSVQVAVANLVARMAEDDSIAQEGFARENVIRPLVTMLSFDTFTDGDVPKVGKSIHSIVEINKRMDRSSLPSFNYKPGSSSNVWVNSRKERENETSVLKLKLKVRCAEALWMLARGSVSNSRRTTETKGLLCLAKLIEEGTGELRYNCLMTVMEITEAAESNADLRRSAFKTNSPASKAVVDQLLGLIKESDSHGVSISAIRAIGFLARTFPARQTNVIGPLVEQVWSLESRCGNRSCYLPWEICLS